MIANLAKKNGQLLRGTASSNLGCLKPFTDVVVSRPQLRLVQPAAQLGISRELQRGGLDINHSDALWDGGVALCWADVS